MCPWDYLAAHQMVEPQFALESRRIGDTLRVAGGACRAADEVEALLDRRQSEWT